MAPPRTYNVEALVLKTSPIGEADLVVTLFTREAGKLRAVAKGARRNISKLVGHLVPLTVVKLSLARGRNLDIITQAQVLESFSSIKEDLEAVTQGIYLTELMDGFGSEASPNQPMYHLALNAIRAISREPRSELPLRYFELHLLESSGLMPELYMCVECRKSLEPGKHCFSPNGGGVLCLDCQPDDIHIRPLSLRALKVLRLLHRTSLEEMPVIKMDEALSQELRIILATAIRYWLDREIQSNSFLEHLHSSPDTRVYS